jgi:N-methylhydantoinase B
MTGTRIDPITFEVIKNALASVADEMALVIMRSAYSPVVRDSMDYSTALCDHHGQVIAQGLTLAVQLGAFPDIMRLIVADHAADARPGDVFIANDPYGSGGQHLPDIYVVMPIFSGGELEGYAATMAHHCDVGGIAPGSVAIHATEVFQEGLRLPILKLIEGGRENVTLLRIIEKNTRNPIHVMGDLRAQLSACGVGRKGLSQLLEKYGAARLRNYMNTLHDHAETLMRQEIASLADGVYRYTDWLDGFGDSPKPLPISVEIRIAGEEIHLDFSGSAAQVPAAINCPIAMVNSASYCAVRCLAHQEIPNCEGYMRPITVSAPEGTIVNPVLPAACGARGVIGYRVFDAIMAALAPVAPSQVIAAGEGGPTLFSIGGYHDGRPFVLTEVMVGSWGARAQKDGIEGISNPAANLSNQPVELIEAELPLEITRYELVRDSEGAGRHRGGLAFMREFRLCAEEAQLTLRSDRRDHLPYGLDGGGPGAPSMNLLSSGDGERRLPAMPMEALRLKRGDVFRHIAAGGGGFGPAIERDPELVLNDVLDDKVSIEAAWERYGVAIDPQREVVDLDATRRRRQAMAREQLAAGQ